MSLQPCNDLDLSKDVGHVQSMPVHVSDPRRYSTGGPLVPQRLSDAEILAEYLHGDREFAVLHAEVHGVDVMSLAQQARPAAAMDTPTA
jgi:hypothetical protein